MSLEVGHDLVQLGGAGAAIPFAALTHQGVRDQGAAGFLHRADRNI